MWHKLDKNRELRSGRLCTILEFAHFIHILRDINLKFGRNMLIYNNKLKVQVTGQNGAHAHIWAFIFWPGQLGWIFCWNQQTFIYRLVKRVPSYQTSFHISKFWATSGRKICVVAFKPNRKVGLLGEPFELWLSFHLENMFSKFSSLIPPHPFKILNYSVCVGFNNFRYYSNRVLNGLDLISVIDYIVHLPQSQLLQCGLKRPDLPRVMGLWGLKLPIKPYKAWRHRRSFVSIYSICIEYSWYIPTVLIFSWLKIYKMLFFVYSIWFEFS